MERLAFWWKPALLAIAWLVTLTYLLVLLSQLSQTPVATMMAPEVEIDDAAEPGA